MQLIRVSLILTVLGTITCSGARPTQPTPDGDTPAAPGATFTMTVDSLGSVEAIANVSEVTIDASASAGSGLRFAVAFGDGDTAGTAVVRHVYRTPGTYEVSVVVTDAAGRSTTSSRQLVVASPLGRWVHSGFIDRRGEVQVRTLLLSAQDGLTVRGVLTRDGNRTIPITGTLTGERTIRLVMEDGSELLEGAIPSVFSTLATWPLTSRGSSIDGQTLGFTRVAGEAMGAAPDAVLGMRFFSFGAPFAVKQISPVLFDGSRSRGEGLTYYLEFGDGQVSTAASATHPMDKAGKYVARLTVVDRFGRSDMESREFEAWSLVTSGYYNEWSGAIYAGSSFVERAILVFSTQEGTSVSGILYDYSVKPQGRPYSAFRFTGTVNGDGQVRLQLADSPVTLTGTMTLPDFSETRQRLELAFQGGLRDGQTFVAHWRKNY